VARWYQRGHLPGGEACLHPAFSGQRGLKQAALWFLFVLFIPLIGVLVYLIARGGKMHEHAARQAQQQDREFRASVQEAAGSQGSADQLAKLADLRDRGVITAEEFERGKAKILAA